MSTTCKMRSILRPATVLVLGLTAYAALAYDPGDYSTWMQLKGTSGVYNNAVWYDPADEAQTDVSAEAGKCYYVAAKKTASSSGTSDTFRGSVLAIAGQLSLGTYGKTYTIPELRLLPGASLKTTANVTIGGGLVVSGTADNPCEWTCGTYSDRDGWIITAPISSAPETVFKLGNNTLSKARDNISGQYGVLAVHYNGYVRLNGSLSGFYGNMTVTPGTHLALGTDVTELPGSLTLSTNVYLQSEKTTGELTIGTLNLVGGSELLYLRSPTESLTYVITNRLTIADHPEIGFGKLRSDGSYKELAPVYPKGDHADLFRLTGEAAKVENLPDVSAIRLSSRIMRTPVLRNVTFAIADGENGDKIVRMSWTPVRRMVVANNYNDGESAFHAGNDSYWEPAGVPDVDLVCDAVLDNSLHFRAYGPVSFPNMTIVANGQTICNDAYNAYLKELHIDTFSTFQAAHAGAAEHKFCSPIIIHDTRLTLGGWGSRWNSILGPISGSGSLKAYHKPAVNPLGVRLAGDNSGFSGDILLSGEDELLSVRPTYYFGLSHKNALGGSYSGNLAWKSVAISTCPWFVVDADLELTEPTRGLYLSGKPTFEVIAGKAMTVTEATTYSGEVTKRGAGRLVLGNAAPQFSLAGAAPTDTPTEGTNVLNVVDGSLEVAAVDAVNGLAVSFGETATLVVNVEATGDLKTYGARNVKWETPFAADAAIPVVFEGEVTDDDLTVAVCTISATAAAPTFDVPETYAHRKVTAAGWRTNADGTRTYEVTLEKMGVILLVR